MNTSALKEIEKILQSILKTMATKDDLKGFATKDDLAVMKKELMEYISEGEAAIISGVEKHVVHRLDALENRVEKVEKQLQQT